MTAPTEFRWQALFQHSGDALFVLNRRRRVLFVNRAWETLAGVSLAEARGLACRRTRPASIADSPSDILAHALCPPPEVLRGQSARTRRLLPALTGARWWDVEFLPFLAGQDLLVVLGRVLPVATESTAPLPPLPEKLVALRERVARSNVDDFLSSDAPVPRRLAASVRLAAGVNAPVLLVGEPGTGKRTLARLIHFQSAARERSFAALDAGRLPEPMMEPVLFGVDRIATVYIHDPGRLPRHCQERMVERLGDEGSQQPRIMAGCVDPAADVKCGRLSEELYAVLSPLTIAIPPLRQRMDELPGLVARMLARANEGEGPTVRGLSPDAWEVVRAYDWPGNLSELFAVLSAARSRAKEEAITPGDLPAPLRLSSRLAQTPGRTADKPLPLESLLAEVERRLIGLALKRANGNRGRAAEILGLWRQRLQRRMEALGLGGAQE